MHVGGADCCSKLCISPCVASGSVACRLFSNLSSYIPFLQQALLHALGAAGQYGLGAAGLTELKPEPGQVVVQVETSYITAVVSSGNVTSAI